MPFVKGADRLVDPPPGDTFVALSFPILQTDENGDLKLRRGEDWRRSHHNTTVAATDAPTHHYVGDLADIALRLMADGGEVQVFGHDLLNAYRRSGADALRHLPPDCRRCNPVVP